jgi:hypothetical protein
MIVAARIVSWACGARMDTKYHVSTMGLLGSWVRNSRISSQGFYKNRLPVRRYAQPVEENLGRLVVDVPYGSWGLMITATVARCSHCWHGELHLLAQPTRLFTGRN